MSQAPESLTRDLNMTANGEELKSSPFTNALEYFHPTEWTKIMRCASPAYSTNSTV